MRAITRRVHSHTMLMRLHCSIMCWVISENVQLGCMASKVLCLVRKKAKNAGEVNSLSQLPVLGELTGPGKYAATSSWKRAAAVATDMVRLMFNLFVVR